MSAVVDTPRRRKRCFCQWSSLLTIVLCVILTNEIQSLSLYRRRTLVSQALLLSASVVVFPIPPFSSRASVTDHPPFRYSDEWTGTNLPLRSLEEAVTQGETLLRTTWDMGRWPDPILRRPATPVDRRWFGTTTLEQACRLLQQTAQQEGAVGLAAQQCGVDARIVYLEKQPKPLLLINPRIVRRSPEESMNCWQEQCLVLPPTFVATVLRDSWVDIQYWTVSGQSRQMRFHGEAARCVQHELGTNDDFRRLFSV